MPKHRMVDAQQPYGAAMNRALNLISANEESPVVYGSVDHDNVTYRLANGKMFRLNAEEARCAPNLRWAYAERQLGRDALAEHDRDNAALLAKLERERDR